MSKQITISDLLKIFLSHIKLIILLIILGGGLAYLYVSFLVTPMYSTSSLILVQNSSSFASDISAQSKDDDRVNMNDITSSVTLANTCATLFTVAPEMKGAISGASVSITPIADSYFLRVTATSSDPHTAANVANTVADKAHDVYKDYFDAGKAEAVEYADVPSAPSSPNKMRFLIIGLLAGLVLGLVISFLLEIVDTTIKPEDDLYKQYDIPVFAEIIDFEAEGGAKKK
ncbi:MAG: hypothetical protein IJ639_00365 [Ruminococcus sp.]|nr:hypothetical protein [Ruminococcus sp.]